MPLRSLLILLFASAAGGLHSQEARVLSLDALLRDVESANPEVLAAKAEVAMAEGMALSAYAWTAPMLSMEFMGMRRRLELSQNLPFPGRTLLKGRVASHAAKRTRAMARMTLEQKIFEARESFYSLARAERVLGAAERAMAALKPMAGLSASRGGFGQLDRMGQVMDTMLAMQLVELEGMLPHWRQERRAAEAALNRLTGRDPGKSLPPAALELEDLAALPEYSEAELWRAMEKANPELEEASHHLQHSKASRALAVTGWLPDLLLEGALEEDSSGAREESLMAGISLPFVWFWGQEGESRAAKAEVEHSRQKLEALRLELREQSQTQRGKFRAAMEELQLAWKKLLPLAERGLKQAASGFGSGSVGANEALMAVKGYFMAEERIGHLAWHVGMNHAMLQMLMATRTASQALEMNHD